MKTNDLKKGDKILLANGWKAKIMDNMKGNTRLAEVYGYFTEIGSVYAHDIMEVEKDGKQIKIEHTPSQLQLKKNLKYMGF